MKKILVLFSVLFLTFSCSQKEGAKKDSVSETYQKEGISFNLPEGWKVKQDYTNKEGRYLELDKYANYKVESTMAISLLKNKQSSDSIVDSQIKQLQDYYQKVNFKVLEEKKNVKLGKYEAVATTYEADDTKNKVYGEVSVIQENDKTISVQIVENKQNADRADYQVIFTTFTIK
jgi:hypothetical protein